VRGLLQTILAPSRRDRLDIQRTNAVRAELARLSDDELRKTAGTKELLELFAATAAIASRLQGQDMLDVHLRGALALARGSIAEMQTGEGKTLAAVPAIAWYARQEKGVHVMTPKLDHATTSLA
jgi:preprotein translocase subunit SecA